MKKYLINGALLALAALLPLWGCSKKSISDLYTNPDAIVDLLESNPAAEEACDPDFIATGSFFQLSSPLPGSFGTTQFRLTLDSVYASYDIDVGDTVIVNNLWAKEAFANAQYRLVYSLTLKNNSVEVTKKLVTDSVRAYKRAYLLQLGDFSDPLRGWHFWGISPAFHLTWPRPNLTWTSQAKGDLPADEEIIVRNEYPILESGDRIIVRYVGRSDDLAFLTINEDGQPTRIPFDKIDENTQEARWRISSNPVGPLYYYYAGVEIYRFKTLATNNIAETGFIFSGLMYRIGE